MLREVVVAVVIRVVIIVQVIDQDHEVRVTPIQSWKVKQNNKLNLFR